MNPTQTPKVAISKILLILVLVPLIFIVCERAVNSDLPPPCTTVDQEALSCK